MGKSKGGASRSDALVLFGVTGDLAHKMIFPALYAMAKRGASDRPGHRCRRPEMESGASAHPRDRTASSGRAGSMISALSIIFSPCSST